MARPNAGRLEGYEPIPGSARKYRTPTGEIISRYEYDSRRLRQAGWRNRGELERARTSGDWQKALKLLRKTEGDEAVAGSAFAVAVGSSARDAYDVERRRRALGKDVLGNRIPDSADPELVSPDGPLARILARMGRRDLDDRWPVGDTPAGIKR